MNGTITGTTRLCAILADPIHHVRTPEAFNSLMAARQADAVLVPVHVAAANLAEVAGALRRMRNLAGFIATVPHKSAMLALCDEASATAREVGAVNVVRRDPDGRLVGEILDGVGFVGGLAQAGVAVGGAQVFLAGAGGAARAIAFALAEAGAARIAVSNRSIANAQDLVDRLTARFPDLVAALADAGPAGFDIAVNATSLGLAPGDPLPFDVDALGPAQVVAEIIMKPAETPLLRAARARGCRTAPGGPMLDCQLERMAEFMGVTR